MPTLKQLAFRHPQHRQHSRYWETLGATIKGGDAMTDAVKRRLLPNPDGRPEKVLAERIKVATYTNKISPILSRFNSQLFAQPASYKGSKDSFWTEEFLKKGALLDGDDDGRASFHLFLSRAMLAGLSCGKAIAQVDTRIASGAVSRFDQARMGELEPYVVLHPRSALWDWDGGQEGFNFVKLHQFRLVRGGWNEPAVPEHDFTIYQREAGGKVLASRYLVTKRIKDKEVQRPEPLNLETLKDEDVEIKTILENQEIFNVKGKFEFPVLTLTLPEELWMGSQLFESQKSYFCQTAALEYSLYANNYAMPIITGVEDDDDDPFKDNKLGEGYYLALKPGQGITSFERGGGTIQTAIGYRSEIKRDIYDTLQQIAMSAADGAAVIARSGESKKEDRRPEQLLLEAYGEIVREFAQQVLNAASIARGEDVSWEVTGFDDFLGAGLTEDIADYQGASQAGIPSITFKKAIASHFIKRAGRALELDGAVIAQALKEIEEAKDSDFTPVQEEPGGVQSPQEGEVLASKKDAAEPPKNSESPIGIVVDSTV